MKREKASKTNFATKKCKLWNGKKLQRPIFQERNTNYETEKSFKGQFCKKEMQIIKREKASKANFARKKCKLWNGKKAFKDQSAFARNNEM